MNFTLRKIIILENNLQNVIQNSLQIVNFMLCYMYKISCEVLCMIILEQIRQRLVEAIKQSGISQTQLASQLNVSSSTISHYIRGSKMPALDTLANLCKILDVSPAYILCFES